MRVNSSLATSLLLLATWSVALVIQRPGDQLPQKKGLSSLREMKIKVESELKSLVSPQLLSQSFEKLDVGPETNNNEDQLYILPRNLLTEKIFKKLGLEKLIQDNYKFNLTTSQTSYENILLPKNFKNMFIFNTTSSLKFPMDPHNNFASFVSGSPPFNLPKYMNLVDYYLVLPKKYLKENLDSAFKLNDESIYHRSILMAPITDLPIFRECISENLPLMVFTFKENTLDTFQFMSDPIMNVKNYLSTNGQQYFHSTFFDNFAKKWINAVNYDSLIHSVFCTTNNNSPEESYCLKIKDSKMLHLFPAFFDASKLMNSVLKKRDNEDGEDEEADVQIEAQALKQLHNKLYNAAEKFNDVTYELATDPLPVIERADERADQMVYDFQDRIANKKDRYISKVEDTADRITGKIDRAENKIKSYKFKPHLFHKEGYEDDSPRGYRDEDESGDDRSRYSILDNSLIGKRQYLKEEEETLGTENPKGGFVLPLSLIRSAEHVIKSPRSNKFSQVIFYSPDSKDLEDSENKLELQQNTLRNFSSEAKHEEYKDSTVSVASEFGQGEEDTAKRSEINNHSAHDGENKLQNSTSSTNHLTKRFSIFSSDDNCENITWFNIFHHSIFGNPKFCINKK